VHLNRGLELQFVAHPDNRVRRQVVVLVPERPGRERPDVEDSERPSTETVDAFIVWSGHVVVSDRAISVTWRRSDPQQPPKTLSHGSESFNCR